MPYLRSFALLIMLLNPFLVIIYLLDVVQKLTYREFAAVLIRAGLISVSVFCIFSIVGDAIFADIVQAEFASFQIFGGVIFLLIGIKYVFSGNDAIGILRGESKNLAGAIAMPILIGPGTISACVVVGKRHEPLGACGVIILSVGLSIAIMLGLKWLHDYVRPRREPLVEKYIEVMGRIMALFVGTFSIQMIMEGLAVWLQKFGAAIK